MVVNRFKTMGARGGGGGRGGSANYRKSMWAMKGNSGQGFDYWNQAIQATAGRLVVGRDGKTRVHGAARKNTIETMKQLAAMHPNSKFVKAVKAGKLVGFNPAWIK